MCPGYREIKEVRQQVDSNTLNLTGRNETFDVFVVGADRQGNDHLIHSFAIYHRIEILERTKVRRKRLELMVALPSGRIVNIPHEVIAQVGLGRDPADKVIGALV